MNKESFNTIDRLKTKLGAATIATLGLVGLSACGEASEQPQGSITCEGVKNVVADNGDTYTSLIAENTEGDDLNSEQLLQVATAINSEELDPTTIVQIHSPQKLVDRPVSAGSEYQIPESCAINK